jgi:enterochelin esterase-like enzyme
VTRRWAALALALVIGCGGSVTAAPSPTLAPTSAPPTATPSTEMPSASPTPRAVGKGRTEKPTLRSSVLNRIFQYVVYLPGGYDTNANARYPVAYVLHGGSGTNQEWIDYGLLDAADRLIGSGTIPPFIIVLPQGDQEYWVDHVIDRRTGANGEKWGTYTAKEVVPAVDARYRTIASPSGRAIGGLSLGGHASMQLSLNFPGIWSAIAATSPSLRPEGDAPTYFGFGAEFAARDPLSLIGAKPDLARGYTWWIDTGSVDPWLAPATAIHEKLNALGITHEWHVFPGDHSAAYWSAHVEDYLRFYASALCRDRSACPR